MANTFELTFWPREEVELIDRLGISERLGYQPIEVHRAGRLVPVPSRVEFKRINRRKQDLFFVHRSHLDSFLRLGNVT